MSQILQIKELIDRLGDIHEKFGNTLCYARSLLWGSVALWAETFEKEDGEPITGEWMAGAGFTFVPGAEPDHAGGWCILLVDFEIDEASGVFGEELRLCECGNGWVVEVRSRARTWGEAVGLVEVKTKGEVRALFVALRRPLKEHGRPQDPR